MESSSSLSVRIVSADHYMALPIKELDPVYSQFRGAEIKQVPVIRIFGSTQNGQKVCLHVHGVFPYLYIPYDASSCDSDKFIYQITSCLEKTLNISLRSMNSTAHHIYKITQVKGIPFYGYHPKEHKFLKIYFYNPSLVKKAADLLQNGSILGQVHQPHESHLPYILQFFIDYNLYGMSFIDIAQAKYRQDADNYPSNIPDEYILPKSVDRVSKSELEIDCSAMHILNRNEIVYGNLAINPGLAAIWENERARNKLLNRTTDIATSQPRLDVCDTKSEVFFKERLIKTLFGENTDSENMSESRSISSGDTINLSNTIYPEENDDATLSNASLIESHSFIKKSDSQKAHNSRNMLEMSFNDIDNKLLDVLKDLEENANVEDDSILGSQLIQLNDSKDFGNEVDISTEDENDLSIALMMDNVKDVPSNDKGEKEASENIWETSFWSNIKNSQEDEIATGTNNTSNVDETTVIEKTTQEIKISISANTTNTEDLKQDSDETILEENDDSPSFMEKSFFKSQNLDEQHIIRNDESNFIKDHDIADDTVSQKSEKNTLFEVDDTTLVSNSTIEECRKNANKIISLRTLTGNGDNEVVITPLIKPLTRSELLASLKDYDIPECVNITPFYSNPKDVPGKKEIGHMTLKIPSRTVDELEEFRTSSDMELHQWRTDMFRELDITQESVSMKTINVFLASESKCAITLSINPPTLKDVTDWLKAKEILQQQKSENIETPQIKAVQFKYSIANSPSQDGMNCSLNDSINVSPCTPLSDHRLQLTPDSDNSRVKSQDTTLKRKAIKNSRISKKRLFHLLDDHNESDDQSSLDLSPCSAENTLVDEITENTSSNDTVKQLMQQSDFVRDLCTVNETSNDSEDTVVSAMDNTHDINAGEKNFKQVKTICEYQYITLLCLEVHTQTRQDLRPDPEMDPIRAVFYAITNDVPENYHQASSDHGVIVVDFVQDFNSPNKSKVPQLDGVKFDSSNVTHAKSEIELIEQIVSLISKWDPDILAGYEIEMQSWGYLIQRASVLGVNFTQQINRGLSMRHEKQWGDEKIEVITVIGRIMLDVWRLLRHEIALMNYTFENVMYNVLQQRVPLHSYRSLTFWWEHPTPLYRWIVVEYYLLRVKATIKLLDQLDLIGRTCELARLFGIQFYEVLSRGSQFRVESMMLRLAKPLNYVAVSPSVQQRAHMRAPEFLPLILEPESRFYSDPVIVLDFQSLYPSMIIAYNYCFSTCLGRVEHLGKSGAFEFGASHLRVSRTMLKRLIEKNLITISPCGVAYVVKSVRQGVLPRMLQEILDTRLMVKKSMKEHANNRLLQRLLHSQQLGLKLIANVTYGYTAANFSGRMPCIEVGDSVVAKGRETLERAIKLVEATEKWGVRVVYGDTDSLFVLVPGRSRERAFEIGAEIAEEVTRQNPHPVKLKLEKVYQPCILQTKKRYVGYMYESAAQKEPVYEAKGIETVRRDGCPAVAKILQKSLCLLFETCDISRIKSYVCRKFSKILSGEMSVQDLIFAREFRGLHSYKPGACVPGLVLARSWMAHDKRSEPRRGERVPYVIVNGLPNTPLIQLVRSPRDLLEDRGLRINAIYYITRVIIPPLNRCLSLIGVDVHDWFNSMPRRTQQFLPILHTSCLTNNKKKSTVSQYFSTQKCAACNVENSEGVCRKCREAPQRTLVVLQEKLRGWERTLDSIERVCKSCCNRHDIIECISLDCPTFFRHRKAQHDCQQTPYVRDLLEKYF